MAANEPQVTFLVPYRIFSNKEDRVFLGKNLVNWTYKQTGKQDSTIQRLESVFAYRIRLAYQSYKPVDIPFSKTEAQKIFKEVFPNGKCIGIDVDYTQHKSRTVLPFIDFQIYF